MALKHLKTMVVEKEDGVLGGFKKGWESARNRHKKAIDGVKDAQREADAKNKEAEKAGRDALKAEEDAEKMKQKAHDEAVKKAEQARKAEAGIAKKAEKEAEASAKATSAEHKQKSAEALQELRDDIGDFIDNFFDQFPLYGSPGGSEDILDKFQTREAALEARKVYQQLADRLDKFRVALNRSVVQSGKVEQRQIDRYLTQADRMVRSESLPGSLTTFVRNEAKFFKRLFRVNNDLQFDPADFQDILQAKLKMTKDGRIPDAVQALNFLFTYMIEEFQTHSRIVRDAAVVLDDEERATRKAARTAAAAKTAAEDEAAAKNPDNLR